MEREQEKPEKPEKGDKEDDKGKKKKKFRFEKELADIMYAFGDSKPPNPASNELLEEYLEEYMEVLLVKAYQRAIRRDPFTTKLLKEDLLYFLQDNNKTLARSLHMLKKEKEFLSSNKAFKELNNP